jgi:glycosyltransferase involved in cell wall biosynthesis
MVEPVEHQIQASEKRGLSLFFPLRVLSLISNQTVMGASKVVMEFCSQASHVGIECTPVCLVRGAALRQAQGGPERFGLARHPEPVEGQGRGTGGTSEYAEALQDAGIRCERVVERGRFDPRGLMQLAALIRKYRPDVIEAHGHREAFYLLALQRLMSFKLVGYFHGWTEASCWTRESSQLSSLVWRRCPVVITVCRNFKERLRRQGVPESRIHVFYNGIDPDLNLAMPASADARRELNVPPGIPLMVVIGRLSGEKGQANFLRAFAHVAERRSDVKAVIVGEGPDRPGLVDLARELRLDSRVVFTGYQRDVRRYYESADLLVVPSKSEGIPNVVLEAMLFGVPVVSTRVGGIPEIIRDRWNGLLVPPENPAALAGAIVEVITDKALAGRLARTAREETLPKFTTLERCAKIADFYRKITS